MTSPATAQSFGTLLKSAHDIMRKDRGLNGDRNRPPRRRSAAVLGCEFEHRLGAWSWIWWRNVAKTGARR